MLFRFISILTLSFTILHPTSAQNTSTSRPKAIIIDTDIFADVDDVGALAVANVLHNCGLIDLKGVMVNTNSTYGALAVSAINTYFNNGAIPIAALKPLTPDTYHDDMFFSTGEYASKLAMNFPRALNESSKTPSPVDLYRSILSEADDQSLTIISIGFLTNLADLLTSSGPSDSALLTAKLQELVIMGGAYPSGHEYNFYSSPSSTSTVLTHFPPTVPQTFSGFELGLNILSGQSLSSQSPTPGGDNPILAAYQWYVTRCGTTRQSWDPITVLYGILGIDDENWGQLGLKSPFAYANEFGYNSVVSEDASNAWVNDTSVTNQRWLKLADGVSNTSVAWILDQFYTHNPVDKSCFGGRGGSSERKQAGSKSEL